MFFNLHNLTALSNSGARNVIYSPRTVPYFPRVSHIEKLLDNFIKIVSEKNHFYLKIRVNFKKTAILVSIKLSFKVRLGKFPTRIRVASKLELE